MSVKITLDAATHEICIQTNGSEIQLSQVRTRKLQGDRLQHELVFLKNYNEPETCAMSVKITLDAAAHEICIQTNGSEIQLSQVRTRKLQGDRLQYELVFLKNYNEPETCAMCHGQLSCQARTRLSPLPEL